MFDTFAKNTLAPLILRAGLAVIFVFHGLGKVNEGTNWGANWHPNPEALSTPLQFAVAWGELVGGIALGLGLLTRLAALGIIGIMAGAIVTVHGQHGFALLDPARPGAIGYEYNFALIVMCIVLIVTGAGSLALDNVFFRRRSS